MPIIGIAGLGLVVHPQGTHTTTRIDRPAIILELTAILEDIASQVNTVVTKGNSASKGDLSLRDHQQVVFFTHITPYFAFCRSPA